MITVVIPYFQRSPGVLQRALRSIAAQRDCPASLEVIVVDDASPAAAADELRACEGLGLRVKVIVQRNGGPGAARNTALDHVDPTSSYVAFIDSDDEWAEWHLARALQALGHGYDFFFGDHLQLGQSVGAFARGGRLCLQDHDVLGTPEAMMHAFRGDLLDQIIRGNVIGTSTVVYDFRRFSKLRFRTEFLNAGEDYLFWMELVRAGARAAFSTRIEATYGRGVNVYSASGWGSDQFALRVHNEMKYRKSTLQLFELNVEQRAFVESSLRPLRRAFAADLVHRVLHRKPLQRELIRAHWSLDASTFAQVPRVLLGKLSGRP